MTDQCQTTNCRQRFGHLGSCTPERKDRFCSAAATGISGTQCDLAPGHSGPHSFEERERPPPTHELRIADEGVTVQHPNGCDYNSCGLRRSYETATLDLPHGTYEVRDTGTHWAIDALPGVEGTSDYVLVKVDLTGGRKNDSGKARFDLIPERALTALAKLYGIGADKYEPRNWERGIAFGRVFAAMMRHAWAWWRGETHDPEDGQHHMSSVAWCAFALQELEQTHPELDDRPPAEPVAIVDKKSLTAFLDKWDAEGAGAQLNNDLLAEELLRLRIL